MKYVKFYLNVGWGSEEIMQYPNDTSGEQIKQDYTEWQEKQLVGGWVLCDKYGEEADE